MGIVSKLWLPPAAVVPQERGPEFLGIVDGADWTDGLGFYRGFFSAFHIKAGKDVWFHWSFPTPVEQDGQPLFLSEISLLWECLEGTSIGWTCLQHGGMERIELTERLTVPPSVPVPHQVPEKWAQYHPRGLRQLSELPLDPPLPLRFGVQLCVMIRGGEAGGIVRFYGAGAAFSQA